MSELSKRYQEIMGEIDNRISNKEELAFVKEKLSEISMIFIDIIDRMTGVVEDKISDVENGQKGIENKLARVQSSLNSIEKDIYDEVFDTEIVCPYCNSEFFTEIKCEDESEIECPECHNIIELDMNSDDIEDEIYGSYGCGGFCGNCGECGSQNLNNNEDDM